MTPKLFWIDPYLSQLDTQVATVHGNDITVTETIFYAEAGGQESDHGTIGSRTVLLARKADSEIIYTLQENHSLHPGDAVQMLLDWERRRALMRLHFAAELVLELTYQKLPIEKIGAHIAQDKARIDFRWDENINTVLPVVEANVNAMINADHKIVSAFSDAATERRYWEIAGFARVPCGGTHLRSTGEIGAVALKRKNVGRGKERIEIVLREPA